MSDKIKELREEIRQANIAWSQGQPLMTDEAYDEKWHELHKLSPTCSELYSTYQPPRGGRNILSLPRKALGMNKCFEAKELVQFILRFSNSIFILEPKYDGVCVHRIPTMDGHKFVLPSTEYDGIDVTNLLKNATIPYPMCHAYEAVFDNKTIDALQIKTPRQTIAGLLNRTGAPDDALYFCIHLIPHDPDHLNLDRPLNLYETFKPSDHLYKPEDVLIQRAIDCYDRWSKYYPIDGIVIKVQSTNARAYAGHNGLFPHWSMAWKPPAKTAQTVVTDIDWNATRTGRIVPTCIVEPVSIGGTTITRVTGNNHTWLKERGIWIGARVTIGRMGDVIPNIIQVLEQKNVPDITHCPVCHVCTQRYGMDVTCPNPECPSRLVDHLVYAYGENGIYIRNLGPNRIEQLLSNHIIKFKLWHHPWYILNLQDDQLWNAITGELGSTLTLDIKQTIMNLSGSITLIDVLSTYNITGLGKKRWKKLLSGEVPKNCNWLSSDGIAKLGTIFKDMKFIKDTIANAGIVLRDTSGAIHYALTGTMIDPSTGMATDRAEIIAHFHKYNYEYDGHINKNTNVLFTADMNSTSNKMTVARRYGIRIADAFELFNLLTK